MKTIRIMMRTITKSLVTRGVTGTIRLAMNSPMRCIQDYLLAPSLRKGRVKAKEEDMEFDRKFGVDTSGIIQISSLDIESRNWIYGTNYVPIGPVDLGELLKELDIMFERFIFVDFGSGKGRAVLLASDLPFKKIIGVEFSEELNRIAGKNLLQYRNETRKCWDIELLCMDAVDFRIPEDPLVLYLYNPFGRPVMARIVENVTVSFRMHARRIVVLYFRPLYADLWDNAGFLRRVRTTSEYSIFDTALMAAT